jgi:hypothetical protein
LLVYLYIKGKITFKKNTEEVFAASKKEIFNFLRINAKNAYTTETLVKNLNENIKQSALQKYIKKNYEIILTELISGQYIQLIQKNGQNYYSFPSE